MRELVSIPFRLVSPLSPSFPMLKLVQRRSYPDITSYCCAAVGGILQEMQLVVGDNSTESQTSGNSSGNSSELEPICETTNYADSECLLRSCADSKGTKRGSKSLYAVYLSQ